MASSASSALKCASAASPLPAGLDSPAMPPLSGRASSIFAATPSAASASIFRGLSDSSRVQSLIGVHTQQLLSNDKDFLWLQTQSSLRAGPALGLRRSRFLKCVHVT